jgi:hypothetical protein
MTLKKRVSQIEARHRHEDEGWAKIRRDVEKLKAEEVSLVHPLSK